MDYKLGLAKSLGKSCIIFFVSYIKFLLISRCFKYLQLANPLIKYNILIFNLLDDKSK